MVKVFASREDTFDGIRRKKLDDVIKISVFELVKRMSTIKKRKIKINHSQILQLVCVRNP